MTKERGAAWEKRKESLQPAKNQGNRGRMRGGELVAVQEKLAPPCNWGERGNSRGQRQELCRRKRTKESSTAALSEGKKLR